MKKLFYLKNSSFKGAYTFYQILKAIVTKQLSPFSLISFASTEKKWKPIYAKTPFQIFFSKNNKEKWILLKKHKNQFLQSGNYSTQGLQILLSLGLISDQDFVWKKNFSSWKRISICHDFHTRPDGTFEDLMDRTAMNYKKFTKENVFLYEREKPPFFKIR